LPIDTNLTRLVTIRETILESPNVKTLVFKDDLSSKAYPGQFLMAWIPRIEEIPMSVMISKLEGHAAISVKKYGIGSTALYQMKTGDFLGIRGPYGNSFKVSKKFRNVLLVGGGTGLVPLLRFAAMISKFNLSCTMIMGARTKDEVIFEKYANTCLKNVKHRILVTTDDGSHGVMGSASDGMMQVVKNERFDCVYTCGPEPMMKKVFELATKHALPIQASLERYMKCGIGICGSCCINEWLVCCDGTIFGSKDLSKMDEFGKVFRDKDGQKIKFK
jgi:dihydroorotate dehydrogenase electron transfer subunit